MLLPSGTMIEPGIDEAADLLERSLHRFADLLGSADDGDRPLPGMEWTVADVGAHLAVNVSVYTALPGGGAAPWADLERGAEANAAGIAAAPTRDPVAQAEAIRAGADDLVSAYRTHGAAPVVWSGGLVLPGPAVAALAANECLIHGLDLARALKRRWPIADADSTIALRGLLPVLPRFVSERAAGFRGTYAIRFRGDATFRFAFDDGTLTITEGDGPADCRLSAAPTAFNLSGYKRVPLWRAAASGGIVAYGRKPWLGFRFPTLLRNA